MIFFLHCLSLLLFFCQSVKTSEDQCAFPFTYNGEAYFSCTMVNSNKEWCSTDSEYKGNYKYCNSGPNKDCIFPFNYNGHYYSECTLANSNSPWCSTDEEYKGNYKYCDKKPNNGPCVFPFTYKGNTYNECTLVNSNNPWCSQDKEYIGNYKYCKENPTETEKPPVVTQKPPVPETEKPPVVTQKPPVPETEKPPVVTKKPTVKTVKPPIPPTKKPTKDKTSTPPSSSCGEYGGRSFYFVNVEKTYSQARAFCHNYGMVVVHVQDKNHNTWLYTKAKSIKNSKWWIGLTDDDREGLYVWDDGYPLNFRAYPRGEPNNYKNEDCTEYGHYPHGLWNDIKCANRRRFICESLEKQCRAPPSSSCGTYGGRSYYFVDVVKTYSQARAFCHNYGMKVAHVRDLHHNAWLFNTARSVKRTTWYIGLTDIVREGAYVWDDGQPITFRAYPLGEPNNFGNEDCTQYGRYLFGQWNDVRCDYRQRFICEAEERQCRGGSI